MASYLSIFLILSAFLTLKCVSTYPLKEFNKPEFITLRPTQVESATAATERAHTGNRDYLPLKREHWAVLCAAISLCFVLATICKYMFCPNVRICGCKQVELQRNDNLSNRRELRPQYSWDETPKN
ncbi:uncharacterized protein LOC110117906 [Ceratitis capitata]|uniref:uncharacterized protein LOC110117906 n=1 Tax=Ceratitis capitata TaxID=7213 RepID=UPI000A115D97|nr:uncharacterized protein LOC110117906 [Ceratitis capitata]